MGIEGGRTQRKDVGIGARRKVDPRRFKGLLDGLADGLTVGFADGFADGFVSRFGRFGSSDFMPSLLTGKLEQVSTFLFSRYLFRYTEDTEGFTENREHKVDLLFFSPCSLCQLSDLCVRPE